MLDKAGFPRLALACLLYALPLHAQQTTRPTEPPRMRSPAKWLVDLARDYAHGLRSRSSRPDVRIVLTLMQAAARLEPNDPEPHRWQVDIFDDLDQPQQALQAMQRRVERDPGHITAWLRWIGLSVRHLQTIEAREQFIREQLARASNRPLIAGDAHRRLAEIALTRIDRAAARKHIRAALKLAPYDGAANRLAYEILDTPDDRADRIRAALQLIAANPMQTRIVWQLANLLDDLSLHRQAQFWYTVGLEVHQAAAPGQDPPPEYLFDLARSQADGGDLEAALKNCAESIRIDPAYVRARLLMIHILRKLGRGQQARAQIRTVDEHYARLADRVVKSRDAPLATEMAWFYARYDKRPDQAMRFAKIALAGPNPTDDARRAFGFAAIAKNDLAQAERALENLAATDQMAAVGLARVYLATKRAHRAVPVLQDAARIRGTGIARDEINRMLQANGLSVPPVPDYPRIRRLLDDFDRSPLEYRKTPARFLRLTLRFMQPRLAPGQPWHVLFELTNTGPFAITLGDEMMLRPELLLSLTTSGDRDRHFPHYLIVHLDRTPLLRPGQSVRVIQTIDIGPLRRHMNTTPQAAQEIRLDAILDPVLSPEGRWTHRLGGLIAPPATAQRSAVAPTTKTLAKLTSALNSDRPGEVLRAAAILMSLLAEHEAIQAGELTYKTIPVDRPALAKTLLEAATRPERDAVLRARIIESFRQVKLTRTIITTLSGSLSDRHWLVRLATFWLFADRQGPAFAAVARRFTESDPDPLVRDLAAAYLDKWQPSPPRKR